MAQSTNRVQKHMEEAEEKATFSQCAERTQEMIAEYPIGMTLGFFAAGLGLGAMIGAALAEPMGFRHRAAAETLGRRILDSISDLVPESVRQFRG